MFLTNWLTVGPSAVLKQSGWKAQVISTHEWWMVINISKLFSPRGLKDSKSLHQ